MFRKDQVQAFRSLEAEAAWATIYAFSFSALVERLIEVSREGIILINNMPHVSRKGKRWRLDYGTEIEEEKDELLKTDVVKDVRYVRMAWYCQ